MTRILIASAIAAIATGALAAGDAHPLVKAADQSVSNGIVSAAEITAPEAGWLVVHKVKPSGKPGPVVGHAPLRAGKNTDVAAILTEAIAPGSRLMLMIHSEAGGNKRGIFEYTLGAKEDGPIKRGGKLVMTTITAR